MTAWTVRHREVGKRGVVDRDIGAHPTREAAAAWLSAYVKGDVRAYSVVEVAG